MPPRKKNYDKMYEPKEEIKEEVTEEPVKETPVEDIPIPKVSKKKEKFGKVVGGSLNVRKTPGGEIIKAISDNENVTIDSEDGDWYKISVPVEGYVMKKFIEVK